MDELKGRFNLGNYPLMLPVIQPNDGWSAVWITTKTGQSARISTRERSSPQTSLFNIPTMKSSR